MSEIITVIAKLSAFTFIITSMLAMGLSLTIKQIIDPLRNVRVVSLALLANFVLVPAQLNSTGERMTRRERGIIFTEIDQAQQLPAVR